MISWFAPDPNPKRTTNLGYGQIYTCPLPNIRLHDIIYFKLNFRDEVKAQIQAFIEHVGYLPNHVDGHQHIHILPEIRDFIAQVMKSYSLNQIRIPFENQLDHWFNGNCDFYNKVFDDARTAMEIYSKHGIRLAFIKDLANDLLKSIKLNNCKQIVCFDYVYICHGCVRTHCVPILTRFLQLSFGKLTFSLRIEDGL